MLEITSSLEPGGLLALEMYTPSEPSSFAPSDAVRRLECPDGSEILLTVDATGAHRYEHRRGEVVLAVETEYYGWHPRGRREFIVMLQGAGFEDVEARRPYTDQPAGEAASFIVYLARRSA